MAAKKKPAKKKAAKKTAAKKPAARRSSKKRVPLSKRRIIKKIDYRQKKYGCYGAQITKGKAKGTSRVYCSRMDKKKA